MVKQVIVIRKDLNMRRGKEIAQGSHASMAWMAEMLRDANLRDKFEPSCVLLSSEQKEWLRGAFTKICVQVNSEEELRQVHENAQRSGLISHLIIDNGATEFNGVKTPTCCAIGPHQSEKFEGITTHLKLY